jgi:hypothetical protein
MIDKIKSVFTVEVRGWIYRVLLAVGLLLVGYGFISSDQLALWAGVLVAVLNVMPTANTSVKSSGSDVLTKLPSADS